jgi:hypothetical protein
MWLAEKLDWKGLMATRHENLYAFLLAASLKFTQYLWSEK